MGELSVARHRRDETLYVEAVKFELP